MHTHVHNYSVSVCVCVCVCVCTCACVHAATLRKVSTHDTSSPAVPSICRGVKDLSTVMTPADASTARAQRSQPSGVPDSVT